MSVGHFGAQSGQELAGPWKILGTPWGRPSALGTLYPMWCGPCMGLSRGRESLRGNKKGRTKLTGSITPWAEGPANMVEMQNSIEMSILKAVNKSGRRGPRGGGVRWDNQFPGPNSRKVGKLICANPQTTLQPGCPALWLDSGKKRKKTKNPKKTKRSRI